MQPCLISRTARRAESGQGVVAMMRATGLRGAACDMLTTVIRLIQTPAGGQDPSKYYSRKNFHGARLRRAASRG